MRRDGGADRYVNRRTSGSPTAAHVAGPKPIASLLPMSPLSTPFSPIPTHSYGIPNGGAKPITVCAPSLHEARAPPGAAWSFPNGSTSTARTFQIAGHSSRQFSFPSSNDDVPASPHSHAYSADSVPMIRSAFALPTRLHALQYGSNGIQPSGYGRRSRYLFTTARPASARPARSAIMSFISWRRYRSA